MLTRFIIDEAKKIGTELTIYGFAMACLEYQKKLFVESLELVELDEAVKTRLLEIIETL